jgi:hypothetical protein
VKTWWSLEEDVPGKILQVPFGKMQDLLERFSVEAAVQDPCVRLSVQGAQKRCPQKISVRDLKVRSQFKLSIKDLWARSLLSSPGVCTRSLQDVSWEDLRTDLYKSSPGKISKRSLLARSLNEISIRGLLETLYTSSL